MEATININDKHFQNLIKKQIDEALLKLDIDRIIESKIQLKISESIKKNISESKMENMARDRISRMITTESLKSFSVGVDTESIYANLENKILIMIEKSASFKKIVKQVLKNSL